MIQVRISAEGQDQQVLEALLERISDDCLIWCATKRLSVQVLLADPIVVPMPDPQPQQLDGMVLG